MMRISEEADPTPVVIRSVAQRVRRARVGLGLSTRELAERSGLSRRGVVMIEAGETNPSLGSLARLAEALGVELVELVADTVSPGIRFVSPEEFPVVWTGPGGSDGRLAISAHPAGGVELWQWRLARGAVYEGESDPPGTQELLYVLGGRLRIEQGQDVAVLAVGHAVRLPSDRPYRFEAVGRAPARFLRIVVPR